MTEIYAGDTDFHRLRTPRPTIPFMLMPDGFRLFAFGSLSSIFAERRLYDAATMRRLCPTASWQKSPSSVPGLRSKCLDHIRFASAVLSCQIIYGKVPSIWITLRWPNGRSWLHDDNRGCLKRFLWVYVLKVSICIINYKSGSGIYTVV